MKVKRIVSFALILTLITAITMVSAYAVTNTGGSQKVRGTTYNVPITGTKITMTASGNNAGKAITTLRTNGNYYASGSIYRLDYNTMKLVNQSNWSGILNMVSRDIIAERDMNSYVYDYYHYGESFNPATMSPYDYLTFNALQYY